jgi:hypothetical protein
MKSILENALQDIRRARNNMSKDEFLKTVHDLTNDANVAVPLMEAASVCSIERLVRKE